MGTSLIVLHYKQYSEWNKSCHCILVVAIPVIIKRHENSLIYLMCKWHFLHLASFVLSDCFFISIHSVFNSFFLCIQIVRRFVLFSRFQKELIYSIFFSHVYFIPFCSLYLLFIHLVFRFVRLIIHFFPFLSLFLFSFIVFSVPSLLFWLSYFLIFAPVFISYLFKRQSYSELFYFVLESKYINIFTILAKSSWWYAYRFHLKCH